MYGETAVANGSKKSLRSQAAADSEYRGAQRSIVLVAVAVIVVLDQVFKWWGWRNAAGVRVNYGGDDLVPSAVNSWYSGRVSGALLDLFDTGLLIAAVSLFLRRRHSMPVLISGTFVLGGWSSNLLDRLVTHYWTAPGSVRGVVDFIPFGHHYYNIADVFITVGTPMFALAVSGQFLRRIITRRPAVTAPPRSGTHRPIRTRTAMLALTAGVAVTAVVGDGAANFGGVTAPVRSASIRYEPMLITRNGTAYDLL
ncbi:MAG TPA: signal peptidase II [Jatrophihabitantaceae bacterium]|jgi:lipoprotein signal peptidase